VVGPLVAAVGFALFAVPGTSGRYWTTFFPAMVVLGLGMAVSVAPLTTTVMNAVDMRHAGTASGISNAVSRAAGRLAVALRGLAVVRASAREVARPLPPAVAAGFTAQRVKLAGAEAPAGASAADRIAVREAVGAAFVAAFRRVMVLAAALAAA